MNTDSFEIAFRETIHDWEIGKLSSNDAMHAMAGLMRDWSGLSTSP